MGIGQAVRMRILELCEQRGWTINHLALQCGLTQSTLNNIISGRNAGMNILTIKKLCDGWGITIQDFFQSDLFVHLDQEMK